MTPIGVHTILGISVVGGVLSAMLVKRFSAPQVMGYIGAGILLGSSGFHLVTPQDIQRLQPFNMFTLGLIGFLVGSELKFSTMKKYGKQFTAILLAEGLLSFLLVTTASTLIIFAVSHSLPVSIAGGVVLGAVASATDPASTVSVLWEYRCAGILTTTVTAIVALDDALAMTLYGAGTGFAHILEGGESHVFKEILQIFWEIFGSIGIGILGGLINTYILRKSKNHDNVITSAVGLLMLSIGIAILEKLDVILASMSFGITLVNLAPQRSKPYVDLIRRLSPPFYVMFFVLVGAKLQFASMPLWLWGLVSAYVIFRSTGKIFGAWIGAAVLKADTSVRQNCGTALLAQGGVAIGLSVMAGQRLQGLQVTENIPLPELLVFTITSTTFLVQLIGPPLTKFAAKRAGEIGRNVTEEDIMETMTVGEIAKTEVPVVTVNDPIQTVIDAYVNGDADHVTVVDTEKHIQGLIGPNEIKNVLLEKEIWTWMLAADILQPSATVLHPEQKISQAVQVLSQVGADELVVADGDNHFAGLIDRHTINHTIRHTLVKNQTTK